MCGVAITLAVNGRLEGLPTILAYPCIGDLVLVVLRRRLEKVQALAGPPPDLPY